jgi:hypothetical protein
MDQKLQTWYQSFQRETSKYSDYVLLVKMIMESNNMASTKIQYCELTLLGAIRKNEHWMMRLPDNQYTREEKRRMRRTLDTLVKLVNKLVGINSSPGSYTAHQ